MIGVLLESTERDKLVFFRYMYEMEPPHFSIHLKIKKFSQLFSVIQRSIIYVIPVGIKILSLYGDFLVGI